jgi:hypothetical protein
MRHNAAVMDGVERVLLRKEASLCLRVMKDIDSANASVARNSHPTKRTDTGPNAFFLTGVEMSDSSFVRPPMPITTMLTLAQLSDAERLELKILQKDTLAVVNKYFISVGDLKLTLRNRYVDEYSQRSTNKLTHRKRAQLADEPEETISLQDIMMEVNVHRMFTERSL